MKKCRICNIEKELNQFSAQKKSPDGIRNYCKDCANSIEKKRLSEKRKDPIWLENERKRGRDKHHRLYKDRKQDSTTKKKIMEKYSNKYPEKIKAARAMGNTRSKIKGMHKHHWSYNEIHWKDTIELNEKDHNKAHRYMVYDQERMMYRTIEGVLLDTKQIHEEYIKNIISTKPE
jgi:hypothetical protein